MRCLSVCLAATLVLGCASPHPSAPSSPAPSVSVPPPSVPAASAPSVEQAPPPAPAEIREPVEVACRISSLGWTSDQLRLRASGPRFAQSAGTRASVVLPVTASPSEAIAVMDDGAVMVRAVLTAADVHLYASKPTPLLGIVTPAARTELQWSSSTTGAIRVGLGTHRVLRSPQPFVVDVACAGLAAVESTYDARATITKQKNLATHEVITDGAPLAPGPKLAPVAELNQGVVVELLETRAGRARILVDELSYMVSGWVSRKDLGPPVLVGRAMEGGPGGGLTYTMQQRFLMHCPAEVALFVELGSERVKVGVIHQDAGFQPTPKSDADPAGFRVIELPSQRWLVMEKTARLVVEAAELEECRQDSRGF